MKNSTKVKAGLLLTSLACAAGATAALVMLQKKREEEVYHEAELKAMDELEEMMRAESDCASCACAEECADTSVYQDAFDDAPKAAEPAAEEPQAEAEEEPERTNPMLLANGRNTPSVLFIQIAKIRSFYP